MTMPSIKRTASDESNGAPAKQPKTEHPEEFSNAVKKKLLSSSRTGQACDRCKVRTAVLPPLPVVRESTTTTITISTTTIHNHNISLSGPG